MMLTVLLIFFLIIGVLLYLKRRYANPYTLTFIFGKKGAGKSCSMVRLMLKFQKKGWHIYTDMKDIRIPDVRIVDVTAFERWRPEPNSVVFLDEVGISMDNRNYSKFPEGLRDFFKYIRKMKCRVYMNSQAYDVDKKVRDTVDSMVLQTCVLGCISIARPIKRTITLTEPVSGVGSDIVDKLSFTNFLTWRFYWMPNYFKYFDSSEMPPRPEARFRLPSNPLELLSFPRRILKSFKGVIVYVRAKVKSFIHFS